MEPSCYEGVAWELQDIPGAGVGVVALRPAVRGERLLDEAPLLQSLGATQIEARFPAAPAAQEAYICAELAALAPAAQRAVWELVDADACTPRPGGGGKSACGIFSSNAFETEGGCRGLFRMASRFNHSCQPNVARMWSESAGQMVFHAIRDITAGEELVHDYCWELIGCQPAAARRALLLEWMVFSCRCVCCSLAAGSAARAESDERRRKIQELRRCVSVWGESEHSPWVTACPAGDTGGSGGGPAQVEQGVSQDDGDASGAGESDGAAPPGGGCPAAGAGWGGTGAVASEEDEEAEQQWDCEHECGFQGVYATVEAHELCCARQPCAQQAATAGLRHVEELLVRSQTTPPSLVCVRV